MTKDQLCYNNDKKLDIIKKVATRVADGLVAKNSNVTDNLEKDTIEFIVNSSIKSVVEGAVK